MLLSKLKTFLKNTLIEKIQYIKYNYIFQMNIHKTVKISMKAMLDTTNPKGINIDENTMITANVSILTHDFVNQVHNSTFIGKNCFIGMNSVILSGIRIGDNVIIGAGSILTKDVPNNCIVAGNPAKIIKNDIMTKKYGVLIKKDNG